MPQAEQDLKPAVRYGDGPAARKPGKKSRIRPGKEVGGATGTGAEKPVPAPRARRGPIPTIVVIGASAGGLEALARLIEQLPPDFPAVVMIVQHMSAEARGDVLIRTLAERGKLPCVQASDGERFLPGHVYMAPSDHHIMVGDGRIMITKGAQENRSRPAIDPLFRSAAVRYGNAVIGVLLTGYLDDGTAGLVAIQRCGGTCIVQLPADAAYPDMPQNALNQLTPDYCVPLAEMGSLLSVLVRKPHAKRVAAPADIVIEARIAERVLSDLPSVEALGEQVPFNCPGCGGVLWKVDSASGLRYRCHTGHAYTAAVLWAEQSEKIEETLWVALRMFEERRNLLITMAQTQSGASRKSSTERAKQSEIYIERLRAMLRSSENPGVDLHAVTRAVAKK
jgi:two-component system chemotaxis response regulator CheB